MGKFPHSPHTLIMYVEVLIMYALHYIVMYQSTPPPPPPLGNLDRVQTAWKTTEPFPPQMPPQSSPHPLAGQSPWHGGPETGKLPLHHHHHAQGSTELGRPRLPHARWPHPKAAPLWRTLSRQAYSRRAEKTLQGQSEGLLKRLQHQHWVLGIACLRQTPLAPPHHKRSQHSRGASVPSSRAEACSTQGQSH